MNREEFLKAVLEAVQRPDAVWFDLLDEYDNALVDAVLKVAVHLVDLEIGNHPNVYANDALTALRNALVSLAATKGKP